LRKNSGKGADQKIDILLLAYPSNIEQKMGCVESRARQGEVLAEFRRFFGAMAENPVIHPRGNHEILPVDAVFDHLVPNAFGRRDDQVVPRVNGSEPGSGDLDTHTLREEGEIPLHVEGIMGMAGGKHGKASAPAIPPSHGADGKLGVDMDYLGIEVIDLAEDIVGIPRQGEPVLSRHKGGTRGRSDGFIAVIVAGHAVGRIGGAYNADLMAALGEGVAEFVDRNHLAAHAGVVGIGKKGYSHR
jgi:hypothetical protein